MRAQASAGTALWAAESSAVEGHARIRARIAGLHCSLCTGTIEKALGRLDGVGQVAVSLTHEQALVDYNADIIQPERILATLRDIGYELYDPRKLRPFEEEEAALVREGVRLLAAITASLTAIGFIATVTGVASILVPASVVVVMVPLSYALLRKAGRVTALAGAAGIVAPGVAALSLRAAGLLPGWLAGWLAGALALAVVGGVAHHILRMAWQSARRGILNQHVLLEIGAFAGIAGGVIGLSGVFPRYPTAAFFAVAVLVANYHIFSEWLSLLVKTRSSQAVKKLLDLQPDLARVVRDGTEVEVPAGQVTTGDRVRIRPGERIPVDGQVIEGYSTVDLSLVTGEPVPAEKAAADAVVSGALNGAGTLLVEATAPASESFLAQVVRHVEDARALKPGVLHLVDRVLRVYTPAVLTISALALVGWLAGSWRRCRRRRRAAGGVRRPVGAGDGLPVRGRDRRAAGDRARRRGGCRLRDHHAHRGSVPDLPAGHHRAAGQDRHPHRRPSRRRWAPPGTRRGRGRAPGRRGRPPRTRPSTRWRGRSPAPPRQRRLELPPLDAEGFQATAGFGVTARIAGHRVLAGRPAFLTRPAWTLSGLDGTIAALESEGHTVVAVARHSRAGRHRAGRHAAPGGRPGGDRPAPGGPDPRPSHRRQPPRRAAHRPRGRDRPGPRRGAARRQGRPGGRAAGRRAQGRDGRRRHQRRARPDARRRRDRDGQRNRHRHRIRRHHHRPRRPAPGPHRPRTSATAPTGGSSRT